MQKTSFPFYLKLSSTLVTICLLLWLMTIGKNLLVPMFFAVLFCIFLIKPCNFLERHGVHHAIAAIICMVFAIGFATGLVYFLSSQIISFKDSLPVLENNLNKAVANAQIYLHEHFNITPHKIDNSVQNLKTKALADIPSMLGSTFSTLGGIVEYLVLIPLYTFLLLLYRRLVVRFILSCFSDSNHNSVEKILDKTKYVIRSYIFGLLLEMLIVAVMTYTGLLIIGAEYALLLAFIVAVLNLIPYLGILIALIVSVIITASTGEPIVVVGVVITIVATHLIDSNIIFPKIVGSKVRINALATLFGVAVGSKIWGIPGMFLAVPVIAILKVLFDGVEELNPWGILLGDDINHEKKSRLERIKAWLGIGKKIQKEKTAK